MVNFMIVEFQTEINMVLMISNVLATFLLLGVTHERLGLKGKAISFLIGAIWMWGMWLSEMDFPKILTTFM